MDFFKKIITLLVLCAICTSQVFAQHKKIRIGLITQRDINDEFWSPVEDLMLAACKDLDMELVIYRAQYDYEKMLGFIHSAKKDKLDALVFPNMKNTAHIFIRESYSHKIPLFLFNANLSPSFLRQKEYLHPRQPFKHWIGRTMPNEKQSGYLLAKLLIDEAIKRNLVADDGKIHIIGITGTRTESPSIDRKKGLIKAVSEYDHVILHQVVYGEWKKDLASSQSSLLIKKYPQTRIIWTASDLMATGVAEQLKKQGVTPNKDVLIGGIDWSTVGIEGLIRGDIAFSVGGHIRDGAQIAIQLYDYEHGFDFKKDSESTQNSMYGFDIKNAKTYLANIKARHWNSIDFKQFSKAHRADNKRKEFTAEYLFQK